jgi:hypothetical protein
MQINKKQLQDALTKVKPGLANKEIVEQSTAFAFTQGRVVTYNDEISISHPIEGMELEGAIQADNLYKFLSKVPDKEDKEGKPIPIEAILKDNEIVLTFGRAKAGLTLQSEIKLPLNEDIAQKGKWKTLPHNFPKYLGFAMSSCSKDMSKPVLTCVSVTAGGFLYASDNCRLTKCDLKEEMPTKDFLLPATAALEVVKLNPIKIAEGKGWVHFKTEEDTIISCRIMEDEDFPAIDKHLIVKGVQLILPKMLTEVLDRAMVFAKREHTLDESVEVLIEDQKIQLSAKSDSGWFKEDANIRYQGDPISFMITPYLLRGIMAETQACTLSKDKIKFEGDDWQYVTLLRG